MDKIGFKKYEHNGVEIIVATDLDKMDAQSRFYVNAVKKRLPYKAITASRLDSFITEAKRRISNAWYMLKGGDCDD